MPLNCILELCQISQIQSRPCLEHVAGISSQRAKGGITGQRMPPKRQKRGVSTRESLSLIHTWMISCSADHLGLLKPIRGCWEHVNIISSQCLVLYGDKRRSHWIKAHPIGTFLLEGIKLRLPASFTGILDWDTKLNFISTNNKCQSLTARKFNNALFNKTKTKWNYNRFAQLLVLPLDTARKVGPFSEQRLVGVGPAVWGNVEGGTWAGGGWGGTTHISPSARFGPNAMTAGDK